MDNLIRISCYLQSLGNQYKTNNEFNFKREKPNKIVNSNVIILLIACIMKLLLL